MKSYKLIITLFGLVIVAGLLLTRAENIPAARFSNEGENLKIDPLVLEQIATLGFTDVFIYFSEQADLAPAYQMRWQERGVYVYESLRITAEQSQADACKYLDSRQLSYQPLEISNALYVWEADLAAIDHLAALPEVAWIGPNLIYSIPGFSQSPSGGGLTTSALELLAGDFVYTTVQPGNPSALTWGVIDAKADQFWSTFGLQGEGIMVANIDTGVQWDHPALDQAYKCPSNPGDPACWYDPSNVCGGIPCDNNGHGTATMGIMVADDDPELLHQAGMAPGAQWIACKGCESASCSAYALTACANWILAPGGDPNNRPHVVNSPWGGGGCDDWFLSYVLSWRAAGIVPTFPPGSSGPGCATMGSPGDYQQVFTGVAHDSSRVVASFSSRGPSCYGHEPYTKPNISAPGVNICTTIPTDSWLCYDGTSFSNSFSAGGVALLLSCAPQLIGQVDPMFEVLQNAADPPPEGTCGAPPDGEGNYTYGYGYLNILVAGLQNCYQPEGVLDGHVAETWTELPLEDATVYISPTLTTMTDATGYYSFTLPVGVYTVTASLDGYISQTVTGVQVNLGQTTEQDFSLLHIVGWTPGSSDPSEINRLDCAWFDDGSGLAEYNQKVYCLGGRTSPGTEVPDIWVFDPRSGSFADTGDNMYEDVSNYTANVLQDVDGLGIYVVGGYSADTGTYINYVQRYDPIDGQVTLMSADPWPLKVGTAIATPGGCVVAQNKIYCFGAFETSIAPYFSDQTWEYDPIRPEGSRWQQIVSATLSVPRGYINVAMQNDIIYAMGGISQYTGADLVPTDVLEALDVNDLAAGWQVLATLPMATAEGRGFGFSADTLAQAQEDWLGKVYLVGGGDWPDISVEAMEYDIATDTWNRDFPDLIQARKNFAGVFIPLCTANPYDGLPGMWVMGGYIGSCYPPFGEPEYYPFSCVPQGEIDLVKTVGTDPAVCAETDVITVPRGTQVTYCYELINSGEITLTLHDLTDSRLGEIWDEYEYELEPWSSTIVTRTVQISETTLNTATWIASDGQISPLQASDTAWVNVLQPSIELTKTVGIDPLICADTDTLEVTCGTQVAYCYEVWNSGPLTLTMHDLFDSQLGELFSDSPIELGPGDFTSYITTTIVTTNVVNNATWKAYLENGMVVSAVDTASVTMVVEQPGLVLTKTVGLDPAVCAGGDNILISPGTQVTYCYKVKNQSDVPLILHKLVDSELGDLLVDYPFELLPGESTFVTETVLVITNTINTATWTAYTDGGLPAEASDSAQVNIIAQPTNYDIYIPFVNKD